MSQELAQKAIISTLLFGTIGGGLYALTGGKSSTLEGMHLALNRKLIENWEEIAEKYKQKDQTDLIDEIKPTSSSLSSRIKKWCSNKGNTYFIDPSDKTYKSYSLWCLQEAQINTVLEKKGFKWNDSKWDKKLEKYKSTSQNFITESRDLNSNHIIRWCEDNRNHRYKYQGEQTEYRVRTFCYWTEEELSEANKVKETTEAPAVG